MKDSAQSINILRRKQKPWMSEKKKLSKPHKCIKLIYCSREVWVKVLEWCPSLDLPGCIVPVLQITFEDQVATGSQKNQL